MGGGAWGWTRGSSVREKKRRMFLKPPYTLPWILPPPSQPLGSGAGPRCRAEPPPSIAIPSPAICLSLPGCL